ncbi:MAG: preprotein translocase subunit SecE [Polymorphobacter sp.]
MAIDVKAKPVSAAPKPRVTPGEFVRQVRAEIAKVSWPTMPETVRMTIMVLIMTSLLSVFFVGIDQVLGRIVKFLLSLAA